MNGRWGAQQPQRGKEKLYGHDTPKRKRVSISEQKSFLTGEPAADYHHEPPVYELKERKKSVIAASTPVSHDVHALIHKVRYDLFHDPRDHSAFLGQASMMSEAESDNYEIMVESPEKIAEVSRFIMVQHRRYGLK